MNVLRSRTLRIGATAATSILGAAAGLVLATGSPALAAAHCDNNGKPTFGAGKIKNNTDQTIMAKGDKYVGKVNGKAKFKTVEVAVGKNGGTASGLCDVDFIKTGWDWLYNGVELVDGDDWRKIVGSWTCRNTPGTGYRLTCG